MKFRADAEPKTFGGVGSWNHGRVHLEQRRIAHYLNGTKVLEVEIGSDAWQRAVAASKFADRPDFCGGRAGRGHVVLQDHGNAVRFRNLRILALD